MQCDAIEVEPGPAGWTHSCSVEGVLLAGESRRRPAEIGLGWTGCCRTDARQGGCGMLMAALWLCWAAWQPYYRSEYVQAGEWMMPSDRVDALQDPETVSIPSNV